MNQLPKKNFKVIRRNEPTFQKYFKVICRHQPTWQMARQICSWVPPGKNFPGFRLKTHRHSLDWPLIIFLTLYLITFLDIFSNKYVFNFILVLVYFLSYGQRVPLPEQRRLILWKEVRQKYLACIVTKCLISYGQRVPLPEQRRLILWKEVRQKYLACIVTKCLISYGQRVPMPERDKLQKKKNKKSTSPGTSSDGNQSDQNKLDDPNITDSDISNAELPEYSFDTALVE